MNSLNISQNKKSPFINEVPINGRETYELYQKLNNTLLDASYDVSQYWELQKVSLIRNAKFEIEFEDKSREIQIRTSYPEHYAVRYGFLATVKDEIIERVSTEGLEAKMCPYNYLGYNIAGVHIGQYVDVCLKEAKSKIGPGDNLVLIIFQYMLGKRKIVPMHDPKVLLAPTPKFDSHICEERPDLKENDSLQYIKSLVYLYEFANINLDPVHRPRHCCPVAAMIFKNRPFYETLGRTGSEPINMGVPPFSSSSFTFLKPVTQYDQQSSCRDYSCPSLKSDYKKPLLSLSKNIEEENIDLYKTPKGIGRNSDSMLLISDRERSPQRSKKMNDSAKSNNSRNSRFDNSRRPSRSSKTWMK